MKSHMENTWPSAWPTAWAHEMLVSYLMDCCRKVMHVQASHRGSNIKDKSVVNSKSLESVSPSLGHELSHQNYLEILVSAEIIQIIITDSGGGALKSSPTIYLQCSLKWENHCPDGIFEYSPNKYAARDCYSFYMQNGNDLKS